MKLWLALTLSALLGYLFGNLNGAILISRLVKHEDVRTHGSGNAGLTNFLRSYGGAVTLIVVLIDFGKTVAACLLATLFLPRDPLLAKIVAGAGVQLGHVFPVFSASTAERASSAARPLRSSRTGACLPSPCRSSSCCSSPRGSSRWRR